MNEEGNRALALNRLTYLGMCLSFCAPFFPKHMLINFDLSVGHLSLFKQSEETKAVLLWEPNDI